jgi:ADP-ribose pyrophosphatase
MVAYQGMEAQDDPRERFRLVGRRLIYQNRWIAVREDQIQWSGGKEASFGVVEMLPGSSILAVDADLQAYLVREFKYAVGRECIEVVSGGFRPEESPLQAAKRELAEELGISAEDWTDLGVVDPFTNTIKSPNHVFLARNLSFAAAHPDEEEDIHLVKLPFGKVLEMVWSGEITHAASCVAILKASMILGGVGPDTE